MADTSFSKFVPGFDFLQGLVKNAGSALPSMGQWVVPTLDPEELERRIEELRTVQFWLDQNSRMLSTTIQALEVQRMTLSALKGMNVTVNELQEALKVRPAAATEPATGPGQPPASARAPASAAPGDAASGAAATGVVDAMEWWNALTQQFTQIASQAMHAAAQAVPETPPPAPKAAAAGPARDAAAAPRADPKPGVPPLAGKRASPRAAKPAPKP